VAHPSSPVSCQTRGRHPRRGGAAEKNKREGNVQKEDERRKGDMDDRDKKKKRSTNVFFFNGDIDIVLF